MSTLFSRRTVCASLAAHLHAHHSARRRAAMAGQADHDRQRLPGRRRQRHRLRMFQEALEKDLGTPLVFEYKPGAGGNVASEYVSKARPTATRC